MKNNIVLKWTLSAVTILLIVIGGYYAYSSIAEPEANEHADHNKENKSHKIKGEDQDNEHGDHGDHDDSGTAQTDESEIIPSVHYENNLIHIELKDENGKAVEDLEVNHEKLMHLIIVNDDLQQYYHLHPEKKSNGVFTVEHKLENGSYKAFIDIKPKDKRYSVQPLPIEVGSEDHGDHAALQPETEFTKTVDNYTVTMSPETFKANEEIVLAFHLNEGKPEPYLGALGHVVILDENGEKYVHVHPASETDTKFATKFDKPGIYKIWGEFKKDGKVHVFPFVVEVK